MPSSVSHAMAAVAVGSMLAPKDAWPSVALVAAVCAVLPDVDAIGRLVNRGDVALLGGHRGLTHSLAYAGVTGLLVAAVLANRIGVSRLRLFACTALATASHGVLDAFTGFGGGVAFLSPFTNTRFEAPWQPVRGLFSELFYSVIPLTLTARLAAQVRGLPWRSYRRPEPLILGLHDKAGESAARGAGSERSD